MILIKLNNDRNNLHTFIEDIETKVFYILYIYKFLYWFKVNNILL